MKKKFLLLVVLIFTGVCFSSLKDDTLKACGNNANANGPAGAGVKKSCVRKMKIEYIEDLDDSYNFYMNPFAQL